MSESKLTVGIADMKMLQGEGILVTYALGSCIGLCFHDPRLHLGALLHIMLPLNMEADGSPGGFPQPDDGENRGRRQNVRNFRRQRTGQHWTAEH